jgi:hypothetical protein
MSERPCSAYGTPDLCENSPVPKEWGGIAGIAVFCEATQTFQVCVRLARLALPALALPSVPCYLLNDVLLHAVADNLSAILIMAASRGTAGVEAGPPSRKTTVWWAFGGSGSTPTA